MSKISKDQAIAKIRNSNPLEISYIFIQRDEPESVKRQKIKALIDLLQSGAKEIRDLHMILVKEK